MVAVETHLLKAASASATVEGKGLWPLLFSSVRACMRKGLFRTLLARGITMWVMDLPQPSQVSM